MDLSQDTILKVMEPLYGMPESGSHWSLTFFDHLINRLEMNRSTRDPCLLFKRGKRGLDWLITLQVDEPFGVGTPDFMASEEYALAPFKHHPRNALSEESPSSFLRPKSITI